MYIDWNIPKHLARFDWKQLPNGAMQLRVFPYDTAGEAGEAGESRPSDTPFFQTIFKTIPLVPAIPASIKLFKLLAIDTTLAAPPLPRGPTEELVGTETWARTAPSMFSWKTHLGWFDMKQADEEGKQLGEHENFWPGMSRWVVGMRMDHTDFVMAAAERWAASGTTH